VPRSEVLAHGAALPSSPRALILGRIGWATLGALVALFALGLVGRAPFEREVTMAAPGFACPEPRLALDAPVTSQAGVEREDVSVVKMSYALQPGGSVDIAGGLSGALPDGTHLFLVTRPDTPGARYYPGPELMLTGGACFRAPRRPVLPTGATATSVRVHVMLVRRDAAQFPTSTGWTETDLRARDVAPLGYITVPG
jgi:hypothetical protein